MISGLFDGRWLERLQCTFLHFHVKFDIAVRGYSAFFPTLAMQTNTWCVVYRHVLDTNADHFRYPCASVVQNLKHNSVALAKPCVGVWRCQHCANLIPREESEYWLLKSLQWNGENPLCQMQCRRAL